MFKNVLFRALLAVAAVSVVAIVPTEASAQERKRPSGAKADAKAKAKDKAKADAKAEAKAAAKEKAKEKAEKVAEKSVKKVEKKKEEKAAAVALANAEATEAATKSANEAHAKKLGKIERLEQIATATNNEALKAQAQKLRELEDKRHGLAMAKVTAAAGGEEAKAAE